MQTADFNSHLDLSLLDDYLDRLGKKTVEQMLTLYCQQVDIYLKDIKQAQQDNSIDDWQSNCHKMKGAAASVGMLKLHAKLKLIEKSNEPKEKKELLLSELNELNEQGIAAFKGWLGGV